LVRLSTWIVYWFWNQINFIFQTPVIQTRINIQTLHNTKLIYFRASNVLVRLYTWTMYWFSNQINFISQTPVIQTRKSIQTPYNTKLIYFRASNFLVRLSTWIVYWFSNQINFISQTPVIQTRMILKLDTIQNWFTFEQVMFWFDCPLELCTDFQIKSIFCYKLP